MTLAEFSDVMLRLSRMTQRKIPRRKYPKDYVPEPPIVRPEGAVPFKHLGGGTMLDGSEYPSDDEWERADGRRITCHSTIMAHGNMPRVIYSTSDLRKRKGVIDVKLARKSRAQK